MTSTHSDAIARRLARSRNRIERNAIFMGYTLHHHYPVLLDSDLLFEHMHVLGSTGTGKTALGLTTLSKNLIRRNDGPLIVIDAKGDRALLNTVMIESRLAGRVCKWWTNQPRRSTDIFNPFVQDYLPELSLPEVIGLFMNSFNLNHGEDYGRAYYSMISRAEFHAVMKRALGLEQARRRPRRRIGTGQRLQSFTELEAILHDLATMGEEHRGAQHLGYIVQNLCQFEQLNLAPRSDPDHPALRHAIHMPDVIQDKQIAYFYLMAAMDNTSVAEIARLVVYSAISAALAHRERTGQRPKVYIICDEAQMVIGQNIATVLAQAREHGISCVLAHQTLSQLNPPGGVDLRELVMTCTAVKQVWSARDPLLKDYISKVSGEVAYASAGWNQLKHRVLRGSVGRQYAASNGVDPMYIYISEQVGPRLTSQDIDDYSRDPNVSMMMIARNSGYSCFEGMFPMVTEWPMSKAEHRRRSLDIPWPAGTEATIEAKTVGMLANYLSEHDSDADDSHVRQGRSRKNKTTAKRKLAALRQRFSQEP